MISQQIKYLKDLGVYNDLVKVGVIPIKVNYFFEIYNYYNVRLVVNKGLVMQSLTDTSMAFKCSESTVKRAIKMMK